MVRIAVEYGSSRFLLRKFHQNSNCLFAGSEAERLFALRVNSLMGGTTIAGENAMPIKASEFSSEGASSEGIMADISLGVTVTSLYTLVGLGIVLAFM
jgi:hypothetical protein